MISRKKLDTQILRAKVVQQWTISEENFKMPCKIHYKAIEDKVRFFPLSGTTLVHGRTLSYIAKYYNEKKVKPEVLPVRFIR